MPYIGRSTEAFGVRTRYTYTPSAGDTSVSGADVNGLSLSFTDGAYVDVFLNGVKLKSGDDYVTTTANTIGSLSAMQANDEVEVIVYDVFSLADMVSSSGGGSFFGQVNFKTDSAVVAFGADNDVTLTHVADTGLKLKNTHTSGNSGVGAVLTLQTGDTDVAVNNVLGQIDFQAPDETTGTDAVLVAAGIAAISEGDFSSSSNATKLSFKTGASETAAEKMALSSGGDLSIVTDGASIFFGADSEIELRHVADDGLILKHVGTGDGKEPSLTFQAGDNDIAQDDILGQINFQAPDEGTGTDAILVASTIKAFSEGDFSSSSNATTLELSVGRSAAAGSDGGRLRLTSAGVLELKNQNTADDSKPILSLQAGDTDIAQGDELGSIIFKAPDEGTGTDAILTAAAIAAESEGDFSSSSNATSLVFATGASEAATEKMRINSAGVVGIGIAPNLSGNTAAAQLQINSTTQYTGLAFGTGASSSVISGAANAGMYFTANAAPANLGGGIKVAFTFASGTSGGSGPSDLITINTNGEAGFLGTSSPADDDTAGIVLNADGNDGLLSVSRNLSDCAKFNRKGNDGIIIELAGQGTKEGDIAVSGGTVSFNGFTGSHWSRFKDNSKPTILRGTVIETIDEMMDWYQVEFTKPSPNKAKYEEGDTIPEGSAVGDIIPITVKRSIELPNGKSVGDAIEYTDYGEKYTGTIIKEHDIKHVKCKISDTADCTNVYGIFSSWDNDDDTVNDMYVSSVGTSVVRIHKDQTVVKGDLITSNGDGTAKKQDDDIIRSKTIGKVLTNIKQETYSDGSYTVPCALYCG